MQNEPNGVENREFRLSVLPLMSPEKDGAKLDSVAGGRALRTTD